MKKAEAEFTRTFAKWAKKNRPAAVYEVKHTRGKDRFQTRELKDHQFRSLIAASSSGIAYKIPDDGRAYKPFDLFIAKKIPAYVVIAYPTEFVIIHIKKYASWKGVSMTLGDAASLAAYRGDLSELH